MDSARKETHVVLVINLYQATDARLRDEQDNRPLPHQIRRPRQKEKNPSKVQATEDNALRAKGAGFFADKQIVITRHVIVGILPCGKITSLRQDAHMAKICHFRHVEADEKPSKESKKGGAKGPVALLKESFQLGCVSPDSHPRKSILRREEEWNPSTPSNFPGAHGTP